MSIIGCDRCGGHYELEEGESLEDFESCQCGGNLNYVDFKRQTFKGKKQIQCHVCGLAHEKRAVICSKCGSILRRGSNQYSRGRHDYTHVLEQSGQKGLYDKVEFWGIASGVIFFIVTQILSNIFIFGGLLRLVTQNSNESAIFAFFSGSLLVSVTIMILSGFIAVTTIKTDDYISGIINGGLVGAFIGLFAGTLALIVITFFAGILGYENAGMIMGLIGLVGDIVIYGALTAFGGLAATYVRRHTSLI